MAYFKNISALGRFLYPSLLWNMPRDQKSIYLTFDDGPHPEITPWVLDTLKKYDAKATFFCVGENIERHPEVFKNLISEGHSHGNHTHNHLKGWRISTPHYLENIIEAEAVISRFSMMKSDKDKLFRPPYGKIKPSQVKQLQLLNYKVVMWDALSGDFDTSISTEECYYNVIRESKAGSIIVFHDSQKAKNKLKVVLPKVLEHYKEKGYNFKGI
ncbi:peptidoglycan/xylan/chitin deacetylase (PgdA/CDA1 family) [Gillisia sp. Hel_I_86]|uniref:polysaccharide deacetylase family protein n=1 Tax=Gillisia sp. Hel_I_86 TaxID=1249981 RepID=UPI0011990E20|nr:polysaccharide deacetylase family protein [Gillisia sp. Hel_I_86]TVZ25793.1 peptidoglycan/xylan/chitin deacetylase (PgdA/CDA1 family) [Gillisia sp. Hel_I_86]